MKKVSGIELLQMIENKEIREYTKVFLLNKEETFEKRNEMKKRGFVIYDFYTVIGTFTSLHLYRKEKTKDVIVREINTEDLLNKDFYIEEEKTSNKSLEKIKNKLKEIIKDIEEKQKQ